MLPRPHSVCNDPPLHGRRPVYGIARSCAKRGNGSAFVLGSAKSRFNIEENSHPFGGARRCGPRQHRLGLCSLVSAHFVNPLRLASSVRKGPALQQFGRCVAPCSVLLRSTPESTSRGVAGLPGRLRCGISISVGGMLAQKAAKRAGAAPPLRPRNRPEPS